MSGLTLIRRVAGKPRQERKAAIAFALPAVLFLVVLLLYPLLDDVRLSLVRISGPLEEGFVGLRNYSAVFSDADFWHSVWVTLKYTVVSLAVELVLGFGLALLMVRIVRGGGLLRTLILVPTMLTPAVAALNFRTLLNFDFGLVNYFASKVGISPKAWIADSTTAFIALVATDVWRSTPFFVLVLSAGLLALSPEILEASELDGANGWRKLIHIQIPMLVPLILVTVLFRVIDLFRTFDTVYVLTNGGPGAATEVASLRIYTDMYIGQYTSYAATEATVFMFLTLIASGLVVRILRLQR
jgi:multiple sugar transport system permease protein